MATNDYRHLNPGANEALADWIVADNGIGQRSFVYHQNRYPVASGNYGLALDEGSSVTTFFATQTPGVLNLRLNMTWATGCQLLSAGTAEGHRRWPGGREFYRAGQRLPLFRHVTRVRGQLYRRVGESLLYAGKSADDR